MSSYTREEILSMPVGRELDALVGKHVMQLDIVEDRLLPHLPKYYLPEYERMIFTDVPHYSTDISAAWEVVEKMSLGKVECVFDLQLRYKGFWAIFDFEGMKVDSEQQKTAPEAICKAALLSCLEGI